MPPETTPVPLFVVGAPRSGTTWLQLLLASAPQVATANETHLFSCYLNGLFRHWDLQQQGNRDVGLHQLMDEEEFLGYVRNLVGGVLGHIAATKPGATVVLEKTPAHAHHARDILKVLPEARFIHMRRDPRAVVASLKAAGQGWGRDWAAPGVVANAHAWVKDVTAARAIADLTPHWTEVCYEDLHAHPQAELGRLFAWLGVEASAADRAAWIEACSFDRLADAKAPTEGKPWDTGKEPAGFFGSGETDGWRRRLSRSDVAAVEAICGPTMGLCGYRPSQTGALTHLAPARPWLSALAQRVEWRARRWSSSL